MSLIEMPNTSAANHWRAMLSSDEAAELAEIERAVEKNDADRRQLSMRRRLIQNRAAKRLQQQQRSGGAQ